MEPAAGIVRERPTGLVSVPHSNRYQYHRSGAKPSTSACTACPHSGDATSRPCRTTLVNCSSSATTHETSTRSSCIPPPSSGFGASRVQITNPSAAGSPEATPSENGYPENPTLRFTIPVAHPPHNTAAESEADARIKLLREIPSPTNGNSGALISAQECANS